MPTTLQSVMTSVKAAPVRRVRTAEGARYYGLPVGSIIRPDTPVFTDGIPKAIVTEQEFLAAWHADLFDAARGLDLGDADDRTAFRAEVSRRTASLSVPGMSALIEDFGAEPPTRKGEANRAAVSRLLADAYIAAAHDAEGSHQEAEFYARPPIDDADIPQTLSAPPDDAVEAVAGVVDDDDAPEPEDMEVVTPVTEYDLPDWALEAADEKIAKANRRAERAGIPERFSYEVVERYTKTVPPKIDEDDPFRGIVSPGRVENRVKIRLNVPEVKHDGYTFVATLTWDKEAGLVSRVAPGQTLGDHAPKARECNVCNSARDRKDTFVVRQDDTGKHTQVGRNCLQQFMGITPGNLWVLDFADDFGGDGEEGDGGFGGGGESRYDVTDVLGLALAVARDKGWVSRANADSLRKMATADQVGRLLRRETPKGKPWEVAAEIEWMKQMYANAAALGDEAVATRDMARAFDGKSDYEINVRAIATADTVSERNLAMLVSAVAAKMRREEQAAKDAVAAAAGDGKASTHLGNKGDKIGPKVGAKVQIAPIDAQITTVRTIENAYGMSTLIGMVDGDGHVLKWFASGNLSDDYALGDKVRITGGSVKDHGEFRGVPETMLTRVKMEVQGEDADRKRAEEKAADEEALAASDPSEPGLTAVIRLANGSLDYGVLGDVRRRLKVGSHVRVHYGSRQVKRGRSWDSVEVHRTGVVTKIDYGRDYSGNVSDAADVIHVTLPSGEQFSVNANGVTAYDESTLAPVGEPVGEAVPAGMKAWVEGDPLPQEGQVVRLKTPSKVDETGTYRHGYEDVNMTTTPSSGTRTWYGETPDGKDRSFQVESVVAVGGTPAEIPSYDDLDEAALRAEVASRGDEIDKYSLPRDGDTEAVVLRRLREALEGNDRVRRRRAREAAREAAGPESKRLAFIGQP